MGSGRAGDNTSLVLSIFERLPVAVLVVDRGLAIVEFNEAWRRFVGRFSETPEGWIGRGLTLDEHAPYLAALCRRVLEGETEVAIDGAEIGSRGGETFWDITARPLGDTADPDFRVLLTIVDANERVAARGLAREREEQFRQLFETTPDAIIIADPVKSRIIDANEAACVMHGYTREELIGSDPRTLLHMESHPLAESHYGTVMAGGVFRTRGRNTRKDGTSFSVDVSGSALVQGEMVRAVAIIRDISDVVSAERALRETHAELERSAAARLAELDMLVDISRELGSTRDIETLMRQVLERAGTLLGYSAGVVLLQEDEGGFRAACVAGDEPPFEAGRRWTFEELPQCRAVLDRRTSLILDDVTRATEALTPGVFAASTHARSWMGVPLLAHERALGVMAFTHPHVGAFTDEDARLMLALGNLLAAAIEQARLFGEADARTRELATLVEVSRDLTARLQPRELLSRTLDRLRDVLGCTGSSLLLMNDREVTIVAARGLAINQLPETGLARGNIRFSSAVLQPLADAMERDGSVIIDDVRGESAFARAFRAAAGDYLQTMLAPIRAWMAVPLFQQEELVGVLAASADTPDFFHPTHARLATGFAGQVAIALETARLFEETERRAKEMESLSRVASVLQLDEPVHRVLARLSERIREATHTVATTVTVVDSNGLVSNAGASGHTDGFLDALAQSARRGARLASSVAVRGRRTVLAPHARTELLADPLYAPAHAWLREAAWEGMAVLPMIYRGQSLGTINAYYAPGAFPDEEELSLLLALADQAAIAMENIRLFEATERRLRGAQSLARVASSLTFDQSVDQTLATLAEAVVGGSRAVASLLLLSDENDELRVAGMCALPEGYGEAVIELHRRGALPREALAALNGKEMRMIRNVRATCLADPAQRVIHPFVQEAEWDTVVIVPVTYHGRAVGTLNAYYLATTAQDDAERAFLATMADQAALALENARLFAETQQHLREIDALYHADEQLHQSLLLDEVLQAMVDVVVDNLHADKSLVVAFDEPGGPWRVRASRGYTEEQVANSNAVLGALVGKSESQRVTRVVGDAASDHRTLHGVTGPAGIKAYIDVPMVVGGETFGVFSVNFTTPQRFTSEDVRLYTALAQRAAMAIENARLYARAQDAASLEERQRLARELHDSVSQALYGIALGTRTARELLARDPARVAEPLDYVMQLAEAGLAELRALIFELRPESLAQEGLIAAFNKQTAALTARHGIEVAIEIDREPEVSLRLKECIYRIGQEAMHNTVKHAHARHVTLRLIHEETGLVLEVSDDGTGFDASGDFPGHLGITSMRERARAVGGELTIRSSHGGGTLVRLVAPLAGNAGERV